MKLYSKGMATLTQTATTTRKIIRYGLFFVIFLIVGRVLLGIGAGVFSAIFPKAPPPPTLYFGNLPPISFPAKTDLPNLEYKLETATGDLPKLSTQGKVYYMPKSTSSLASLEEAKRKAFALGFTLEPEAVSQTIYRFRHPRLPSTLEINIVSGIFSISYDLSVDPTPIAQRPSSSEIAEASVRNFLSQANLLPTDLAQKATHEFLKIEGRQLLPALSLSEAQLIRINLFRKDYPVFNEKDLVPSMPSDPTRGNIWFLVSGDTARDKQIIGGEFHYFPVDETQVATYPLKTTEEAYAELASGKGYVANLGLNSTGKITIRKVYLAYFDPKVRTDFMQPIFVFEGDGGFVAYTPAITSQYYQSGN